MYAEMIQMIFGMFDPPDIETYDISEPNSQNSIAIGVVKDKENI